MGQLRGRVRDLSRSLREICDERPEFLSTTGSGAFGQQLTSAAQFAAWWTENPAVEKTVFNQTLTLVKQPDDSYVYDSSAFFNIEGPPGRAGDEGKGFRSPRAPQIAVEQLSSPHELPARGTS